jgi:hypothetical protein
VFIGIARISKKVNLCLTFIHFWLLFIFRRINQAYLSCGDQKIDVITHSYGGLVFRTLIALDHQFIKDKVRRWIAVSCPFHGASGKILKSFLFGYDLFIIIIIMNVHIFFVKNIL